MTLEARSRPTTRTRTRAATCSTRASPRNWAWLQLADHVQVKGANWRTNLRIVGLVRDPDDGAASGDPDRELQQSLEVNNSPPEDRLDEVEDARLLGRSFCPPSLASTLDVKSSREPVTDAALPALMACSALKMRQLCQTCRLSF